MPIRDFIRRAAQPGPSGRRDATDSSLGRALAVADTVERELWLIVTAAMLVDVTLTVHGLMLGLPELNPVARVAFDAAGVFGLYGLKAGALCVGGCCRLALEDPYGPVVPLGLGLPSVAAVCINSVVIATVTF